MLATANVELSVPDSTLMQGYNCCYNHQAAGEDPDASRPVQARPIIRASDLSANAQTN